MTTATPASRIPEPAGRRRWPWWRATIWGVVSLAVVTGVVIYWLWSSEPTSWQRTREMMSQKPAEEVRELADSLERGVVAKLSHIDPTAQPPPPAPGTATGAADAQGKAPPPPPPDPNAPRTLTITPDAANAWLKTKLPKWLANQKRSMPDEIQQPTVWIDDGRLVLAFRLVTDKFDQVFSAALDAKMTDDGRLSLRAHRVWAGRLPVPFQRVINAMDQRRFGYKTRRFLNDLAGDKGYVVDPVQDVDGRKARLLGFAVKDNGVELTFRVEDTHPRAASE
jgi:hypothetical protein